MTENLEGNESAARRIPQNSEARTLLDEMQKISPEALREALDKAQEAKKEDPAAGIFIANLDDVAPVEIGGQEYHFYGARVLAKTMEGGQPYVTPHMHKHGTEPYFFNSGTGEMNFGWEIDGRIRWDEPVVVRQGDEFLIQESQVHSFRNVGEEAVDFVFSCPESHLQDHSHDNPEGDRYIIKDLPGGIPAHFEQ